MNYIHAIENTHAFLLTILLSILQFPTLSGGPNLDLKGNAKERMVEPISLSCLCCFSTASQHVQRENVSHNEPIEKQGDSQLQE